MHKRSNDSVHWFLNDLTSRIVAESGRPSDRFHLGKMLLQSLKDDPELIMQVDGATGESETSASALERSVRCAIALKSLGLKRGDVMILMAPNHIDLAIPFYAALYLGITVAAVDRTLVVQELRDTFELDRPKIVFCQSEKAPVIQLALNELELDSQIVTFDKGDYLCSFSEFLEKYNDGSDVEDFQAEDFDPDETIALLIATSGTTGLPKAAAVSHKNFAIDGPYIYSRYTQFPMPTRMVFVVSPLQWLTAIMQFILTPLMRMTRLQTSHPIPIPREHYYHVFNTYKPTYTIMSPTLMATLIKPGDREGCDFTCLETLIMGGSAVPQDLVDEVKGLLSPVAEVINCFGMSELSSVAFQADFPMPGSCGKPIGCFQYRLINVETQEDITEPNIPGELWMKGPGIFKGYHRNPKATEETFADDGWFKTGDLFYRDENWNFFFVERIKLLLKYKNNQISPVELENVIRQHPGVHDVAVTGISHPEDGELPVACVVRRPGHDVTEDDIKKLVEETLTESKHLRGGVIFMSQIPMTASTKIHRRKLKEMALLWIENNARSIN